MNKEFNYENILNFYGLYNYDIMYCCQNTT